MMLSQADIALLKELKAAGERGRTIRAYSTRLVLDRLAKGGYVVARPTGLDLVQYRITQRGQDAKQNAENPEAFFAFGVPEAADRVQRDIGGWGPQTVSQKPYGRGVGGCGAERLA